MVIYAHHAMLKNSRQRICLWRGPFRRHFNGLDGNYCPQHVSGCHNYRVCQIKPWFRVSSRVLGSYCNSCIQQYVVDLNDPLKYGFLVGS